MGIFNLFNKKKSKSEHWYFAKCISDGDEFRIYGLNIWDLDWKLIRNKVEIIDPNYHNKYYFDEYEIEINNSKVNFVAGEFSNLIWGFYLKDLSLLNES